MRGLKKDSPVHVAAFHIVQTQQVAGKLCSLVSALIKRLMLPISPASIRSCADINGTTM